MVNGRTPGQKFTGPPRPAPPIVSCGDFFSVEHDFDLLGDPIPAGHGRRGRPEHIPTSENRSKVMLLMAMGWVDARIANALSVSIPTLRKHYFRELKTRDQAMDRVEAGRVSMLWAECRKGNVGAMREFGRLFERATAQRAAQSFGDEDERPERLGKKALARRAAESAGGGSDWGGDLLGPTAH